MPPKPNRQMRVCRIGIIQVSNEDDVPASPAPKPSPHFSPAFYCGGGSGHVYCVALGRAPRRTVEYACGALRSRALYPCPSAPPRYEIW